MRTMVFLFVAGSVFCIRALAVQIAYLLGSEIAVPVFEGRGYSTLSWAMAVYYLVAFLVQYNLALEMLRVFISRREESQR